jgi:uncharacterized protein DUF6064
MLPFTSTQFFDIFGAYNISIWPMQVAVYGLAFVGMAMLFRPGIATDRFITAVLALMWGWTGIAYHWLHFYAINPAALLFGAAFVIQGAIFLVVGTGQGKIRFKYSRGLCPAIGVVFILYASIIYPAIGMALGHSYPNAPVFGVTPCPVSIFTFGCLLLLRSPTKWWVIVLPVLWSLIGGTAAFLLDVPQDWLLLVSGAMTVGLLAKSRPPSLR